MCLPVYAGQCEAAIELSGDVLEGEAQAKAVRIALSHLATGCATKLRESSYGVRRIPLSGSSIE